MFVMLALRARELFELDEFCVSDIEIEMSSEIKIHANPWLWHANAKWKVHTIDKSQIWLTNEEVCGATLKALTILLYTYMYNIISVIFICNIYIYISNNK